MDVLDLGPGGGVAHLTHHTEPEVTFGSGKTMVALGPVRIVA